MLLYNNFGQNATSKKQEKYAQPRRYQIYYSEPTGQIDSSLQREIDQLRDELKQLKLDIKDWTVRTNISVAEDLLLWDNFVHRVE